ncbi:MAG: hypothetical protein E4H14_02435 [Candidatus Thorarchaeota archaeon]|nr:MAG: hypothetical protein E4H14_02435 [Candidatus Thorarchaeota archaeon]
MPKAVRSAKGQTVNFDLLKIKQQMASAPKTTTVQAREAFIDQKFKRRLKKMKRVVTEQVIGITVEKKKAPQVAEEQEEENTAKE